MIVQPPTPLTLEGRSLEPPEAMSAVEQFARRHEAAPDRAGFYRDLIPLEAPKPGEQYAFEVDLDACSGCKACVTACHHMNGLDDGESWRDVGLLIGAGDPAPAGASPGADAASRFGRALLAGLETGPAPDAQHVTTACHHCLEPGCLEGCPVLAYEKDPVTGIVKHLDDQCIGCQYCLFKCHREMGIVRKCDMCSDRLAAEEAPACAAACPTGAIRIGVVARPEVMAETEAGRFLPASPDPRWTRPTTRYQSRRDFTGARDAGADRDEPEHAHMPLVIMLVLTQLAAGTPLAGLGARAIAEPAMAEPAQRGGAAVTLLVAAVALAASTLHLGRPRYAFRAVLGLGTSWLSREIVAFGAFAALAFLHAALAWLAPHPLAAATTGPLSAAVVLAGLAGVGCSAMVYADTPRPFWRLAETGPKFLLTTLMLGIAATLLVGLVAAGSAPGPYMEAPGRALAYLLAGLTLAKLAWETRPHLAARGKALLAPIGRHTAPAQNPAHPGPADPAPGARLLAGPLAPLVRARLLLGLTGGVLLPLILAWRGAAPQSAPAAAGIVAALSLLLTTAGELLERTSFFAAARPPRMPGGLPS